LHPLTTATAHTTPFADRFAAFSVNWSLHAEALPHSASANLTKAHPLLTAHSTPHATSATVHPATQTFSTSQTFSLTIHIDNLHFLKLSESAVRFTVLRKE
jgi:hypothetical protein